MGFRREEELRSGVTKSNRYKDDQRLWYSRNARGVGVPGAAKRVFRLAKKKT
jgi:hypothetical protein